MVRWRRYRLCRADRLGGRRGRCRRRERRRPVDHCISRLVGEDQADASAGLINWGSPLGRALLGAQVGDEVLWKRPAGDQLIEVLRIEPEV